MLTFREPEWRHAVIFVGLEDRKCRVVQSPVGNRYRERGRVWPIGFEYFVLFFSFFLMQGLASAQLQPARRILILNEVNPSYPATALINGGIQTALSDSPYRLEFYFEHFDTILFPDPATQQEFRDFYVRKYRNRQPDLIITVGSSPLKFMRQVHENAFPGVPVVFCLPIGDVPSAGELGSEFTGVENDMAPAETLKTALRLQPGTEHVVVVGGVSDLDRHQQARVKQQIKGFTEHLDVTYLTDLAMPELRERLRRLPPHTVVLLLSFAKDAQGTDFKSSQTGPLIAAASNAPVFSLWDVFLNHGEVGGYLSNLNEQGKLAGVMALRILHGEKPQAIARVKGVNTYMFDWRAVKRWVLKESEIPPGSIVLNRQPTIWRLYKGYIIGSICLMVMEGLLIGGLLTQRAGRRKVEADLVASNLRLRESEERFRLVANTAPVMIWMSGTDKLCNYFNQTWLDFTGRPLEAELGHGWTDGVHPEDLKGCMDVYTRCFDRRESFQMQYRLRRHDGEYRWLVDIGAPRSNPDGSFDGYIGSCMDITERKQAEEALAGIGRRLIEAHEEERTWIARELHDDINQRIAMVTIDLERWDKQLPDLTAESHRHIIQVRKQLLELARDIQALSHRLHSTKLEYLGIVAAVQSFCKEFSEQQNVEIEFSHTDIPDGVPSEVSLCLFRVLQEALQNAVKHSRARQMVVQLGASENEIQLTVTDHGLGFDSNAAINRRGLGLISMRERVHLVGGQISIDSKPGGGTRIHARAPFSSPAIPIG